MIRATHLTDCYEKIPLKQVLEEELLSNSPNHLRFAIAMGKACKQPCDPQSLNMALKLFDKQGDKWLDLIERFTTFEFKLVFSFCIKNIKTYPALIHALLHQGDPQRQAMFEINIEKTLDEQIKNPNFSPNELWRVYILYLKNWSLHLPHRTILALEKIENRLRKQKNLYQEKVEQIEIVEFIHELARIVRFHEQGFMAKLELRKFWHSIPATITFIKNLLSNEGYGLIDKMVLTLQSRSPEGVKTPEQEKEEEKQKEDIVLFFTHTCEVSILQETYLQHAARLAKELVNTKLINYWKYDENEIEDLITLENSLIYEVQSDDLPSLLQKLLSSLAKHIPSFLTHFLTESSFSLFKQNLNEITTSDIVLKLCILSKPIIQHFHSNEDNINIQEIISRLVNLSDYRSEMVQIKTLKLMHYFREILPQKNFLSYHEIIFRVIKRYIINKIQKINNMNSNQMTQNQNFFINSQRSSIYTKISYNECIKILEEDTEKSEDAKTSEMRIRKAKFLNSRFKNDFVKDNQNWISDKFLELISVEGYCNEQSEILKLFRIFLNSYTTVAQRSTYCILRVLSKQFMLEFQRLRSLSFKKSDLQKLFETLNCITFVVNQINEDTYMDCEETLVPILILLNEPYDIRVEKELLQIVSILIDKVNMITPELSNFIVYSQEVLKKGMTLLDISGIIQKLCKLSVISSVKAEWSDLVNFFTKIFQQYFIFAIESKRNILISDEWVETIHFTQMFFQTYQQEYLSTNNLSQMLLEIQSQIEKVAVSEAGYQLLMTIHHINPKCKLYPYHSIADISLYKERYSLHMATITMMDIITKNFRTGIFQFDEPNNDIYPFLDTFAEMRRAIQGVYFNKQSTPNDKLPFAKINLERYIQSSIGALYKDKLIDITQQIELKNKLLDDNYLINPSLFK